MSYHLTLCDFWWSGISPINMLYLLSMLIDADWGWLSSLVFYDIRQSIRMIKISNFTLARYSTSSPTSAPESAFKFVEEVGEYLSFIR